MATLASEMGLSCCCMWSSILSTPCFFLFLFLFFSQLSSCSTKSSSGEERTPCCPLCNRSLLTPGLKTTLRYECRCALFCAVHTVTWLLTGFPFSCFFQGTHKHTLSRAFVTHAHTHTHTYTHTHMYTQLTQTSKPGCYIFGAADKAVFVREVRHHLMVRTGGGWDTLVSYLAKLHAAGLGARPAATRVRSQPGTRTASRARHRSNTLGHAVVREAGSAGASGVRAPRHSLQMRSASTPGHSKQAGSGQAASLKKQKTKGSSAKAKQSKQQQRPRSHSKPAHMQRTGALTRGATADSPSDADRGRKRSTQAEAQHASSISPSPSLSPAHRRNHDSHQQQQQQQQQQQVGDSGKRSSGSGSSSSSIGGVSESPPLTPLPDSKSTPTLVQDGPSASRRTRRSGSSPFLVNAPKQSQ